MTAEKLILASSSESRRLLLERAGIAFKTVVSGVDETVDRTLPTEEKVKLLARRKAEAVLPLLSDEDCLLPVIAADSLVFIDGETVGKPANRDDARRILGKLSGRRHRIYTGVCVLLRGKRKIFSQSTEVEFYTLSQAEIDGYIDTGEPFGKAGGYGIEGRGMLLIRAVNGDYTNVVGLPVAETMRSISELEDAP